jgi:hypothetical protein
MIVSNDGISKRPFVGELIVFPTSLIGVNNFNFHGNLYHSFDGIGLLATFARMWKWGESCVVIEVREICPSTCLSMWINVRALFTDGVFWFNFNSLKGSLG